MTPALLLRDLSRDLRHALRQIRRQPLLASVVTVTLALGIGATTAISGVLDAVLLAPLPYRDDGRVVILWNDVERGQTTWISVAEHHDYRAGLDTLQDVASFSDVDVNLTGEGEPLRVGAAWVTPNVFDVLGVGARHGRVLQAGEEGPDATVAVLAHGLFVRRFGGDPGVVGRSILVDGQPRTVVGVMPAGFRLPLDIRGDMDTEMWMPVPVDRASLPHRGDRGFHAVGRLAPGATLDAARQELRALHERWGEEGLLGAGYEGPGLVPVRELVLGEARPLLLLLAAASALVLLIACANVASLLLARGEGRRRELGVRAALGAGRLRLLRQALTESLVMAGLAGLVGFAAAVAGIRAARAWAPPHVPRLSELSLDGGLLLVGLAVTVATGLLFGALPALQASRGAVHSLLAGGDGERAVAGGGRMRRGLVVGEIALAVALAVAALLMLRSFAGLRGVDPGFRPAGVLTLGIELPSGSYADEAERIRFWDEAVARIESLPGVETAGAIRRLPLARQLGDWSITVEGRPARPGENPHGDFQVVVPGYFETLGVRLAAGRLPGAGDRADTLPVVVINRTMAAEYWPDQDPLGKRFRIGSEATPWYSVVGVVEDVVHNALTEEPRTEMYFVPAQWDLAASVPYGMTLVLRTPDDPLDLAGPVRAVIRDLDADLPVADLRTMGDVLAAATADSRFAAALLAAFGAVAVLLAATGIYGVVACAVGRRTREIGIRMAIGADRRRVVRHVVGEGLAALAAGLAAGVVLAALGARWIASLLYGVAPLDPASFAVVAVVVSVVAVLASWLPAQRAAAVDPVQALRSG